MSLNCLEIDAVLAEIGAEGALVQSAIQPTYDSLVLNLYRPSNSFSVFVSLSPRGCRVHLTRKPVMKPPRPLRFMEFLKARIVGARIEEMVQLGSDRIVRMKLVREGEETRLYARLWSNAANVILTDSEGTILDAMFRRPKKGEAGGLPFRPEEDGRLGAPAPASLVARKFPGEGSLSERIEAFYDAGVGLLSVEELRKKVESRYSEELGRVSSLIASIESKIGEASEADSLRETGDVLLSLAPGYPDGEWVEAEDYRRPGERLRIRVQRKLSLAQNAEAYYDRSKRLKSSRSELERQLAGAHAEERRLEAERASLLAETDPLRIERSLRFSSTKAGAGKSDGAPGIRIETAGWTLIVGKTAKDNDELLRRHMRGNDYWLHARDWAGAYVFIKGRKNMTPPLDVLLDAANLAIYHSKGRSSGKGDVYYTMVKYLRRAKDGPKGLVLPTQEKNLSVSLDPDRLARLKGADAEE